MSGMSISGCRVTLVVAVGEVPACPTHTGSAGRDSRSCCGGSDWWSSRRADWTCRKPRRRVACPGSPRQKSPGLSACMSLCVWPPWVWWPAACCLRWPPGGWSQSRCSGPGSCWRSRGRHAAACWCHTVESRAGPAPLSWAGWRWGAACRSRKHRRAGSLHRRLALVSKTNTQQGRTVRQRLGNQLKAHQSLLQPEWKYKYKTWHILK